MKATNSTQRCRTALKKISQIHQLVRPSVSDYLLRYQTSLTGKAARAFEQVRYSLLAFLGPLASREISVLSPALLQQFICQLLIQYASGTVLKKMAFIQKALETAVAQGWVIQNPMRQVQLPAYRPQHPVCPLTDDELEYLYRSAPDNEWRCVVVLGFYGLLTFSEMAVAQAEDFDILNGKLSIRSRRPRLPIELAAPACRFLRSYVQEVGATGPLLPRIGTFSRRRFNACFRRLMRRAGIPALDVRFASLRLSALTHLSNGGVSGTVMRAGLGHSPVKLGVSWCLTPVPRINLRCLPDITGCQSRCEQGVTSHLNYDI